MQLVDAELLESRQILPGQWLQHYHAPALATSTRAGQFVHVRTGDWSGLVLRRPFTVNTADPGTGAISIHFREVGRGTAWMTRMRPGDHLDMLGPLGQGFQVDTRSRHLLLVAGGLGIADVRLLADEALRDGRQVVLLYGCRDASEVYPSSLLPDEVEYVVATDDGSVGHHGFVTDLVVEYEAWADQAFACGPLPDAARPLGGGGRAQGAHGRRDPGPQARGREAASARIPGSPAQGVPPDGDGAEHGLRGGGLPGLRDLGRGRPPARLSRGPGLRQRRDRLGGDRRRRDAQAMSGAGLAVARDGRPDEAEEAGRHPGQGAGPGPRQGQAHADRAHDPERDRRAEDGPAEGSRRGPAPGSSGTAPASRAVPSPIVALGSPTLAPPAPGGRRSGAAGIDPSTVDLSVDLGRGLVLANPVLVASGTFGYGVEYADVVDISRIGAICCKGTTLKPRTGNRPPRVTETPGGMLNSIGLQNPGVDAVLERYAPLWATWAVPVIVNVAGESIEDYVGVVRRLDQVPGVAGVELNISCPNVGKGGLQFAIDQEAAAAVTRAVRRATDLPLIVKLSPNVADIRPIAAAIAAAGADALSAVNTLSGMALRADRTGPFLGNTYGGLSGPGDQAGRPAHRLRGRPGGRHPGHRDRGDHLPRRRAGLPGRRRGRGPGRDGDLRRPDAARSGSSTSCRRSAPGAASPRTSRWSGRRSRGGPARHPRRAPSTGPRSGVA